ncbi:hypothetical protein NQ314_001358 [Rhamnusium bicolor]|uniref:P21-activated protein kinase-interacting protein 1-like n=1 Tax=Rhamnusium bicolor TaxID=1586634 RepID=A0AAV8ZUK3_9CUCU|nr:hypothetical protein NQ314_001358 [Rhamnusium bicolor]
MKTSNFEIIAGTYEEFLLGYNFNVKQSEIVQSFAAHDHSSSIRSLCISGHYLATGAADDRIIIYDLKSRKEHCMLTHHDATVTCLQFTNNHSHILSGSSDGVLAIVRVGNWQVEKVWDKAHKGSAILDIAVHSSGKLALTLGSDCTLRTWNLVKGRQAYAINLNSKCKDAKSLDKIVWAKDDIRFVLSGGKYTEIWSIEMGGVLKVVKHEERVSSCIWFSDEEILVGYEDGQIALVQINDLTKSIQKAHDGRVKVLALYNNWVVSGSSTGEIKVWNKELKELTKQNSGCRITCLGIATLAKIKEEKIVETAPEETVSSTVIKKSSVVIEVEENNDESIMYHGMTTKEKRKKHGKIKKNKKNKI